MTDTGPWRPHPTAFPARIGVVDVARWPATFDEFSDLIEEVRFARDSPLEGDGFELPVPGRIYSAAIRSQVIWMRLGGVEAVVGATNFYERVTDAVRAWQQREEYDAVGRGTA